MIGFQESAEKYTPPTMNRRERRESGLHRFVPGHRLHPATRASGRPFRRAFAGIATTSQRISLAKAGAPARKEAA